MRPSASAARRKRLQAGDHDMIATLFEQFNRTLRIVAAHTKAYFGFEGYWWPEYVSTAAFFAACLKV